jgi:hypothetical protein
MKVIGIGKTNSVRRPEQILLEVSDVEFANLVGHYSLYSDKCPSPIVGTEFTIHEIWNKTTTLANANYALTTIKENVDKLLAALPKNLVEDVSLKEKDY